jgi:hypothetical protein
MSRERNDLTARVVALTSPEAGDRRMSGTVEQRVAMVGELTRIAWQLAGLALPAYSRATMPVVRTALAAQVSSTQGP